MLPTWKEDLKSLHEQRKNLLRSLRFLYEQISKVSRVSVTTHNEIEEIKIRLLDIEKKILQMQESLGKDVENLGVKRIEGFSPYLSDNRNTQPEENIEDLLKRLEVQAQKPKSKKQYGMILIILGIVAVLVVSLLILVRSGMGAYLKSDSQISSEISVYPSYYHIGDVYLQQFHSANPQPNPFISKFQISTIGIDPRLILTASDVDPNVSQSPVRIYINDNLVGYLNNYFTEETFTPKEVSIPVDASFLKIGDNKIRIESQVTTLEYQAPNLDDFEFWDIKLEFFGGK